jgi:hypothetical protein
MRPACTALLLLFGMLSMAAGQSTSMSGGCAATDRIRKLVAEALPANEFGTTNLRIPAVLPCPSTIRDVEDMEVARVKWDALVHSFEVRIQCKSAPACLPFVVRIPADPTVTPRGLSRNPEAMSKGSSSRKNPFDNVQQRYTLVKAGQKVTLLWQENGLRITRSVICLESGREGQSVRTRGPVLRARVLNSGWVEAQP